MTFEERLQVEEEYERTVPGLRAVTPRSPGSPCAVAVPRARAMEPLQGLELSPVTVCKKRADAVCGCSCTGAFPRTLMQPELGGS